MFVSDAHTPSAADTRLLLPASRPGSQQRPTHWWDSRSPWSASRLWEVSGGKEGQPSEPPGRGQGQLSVILVSLRRV